MSTQYQVSSSNGGSTPNQAPRKRRRAGKGGAMTRKVFAPTREFEASLAALAQLCVENKWSFPTVEAKELHAAADKQRRDRAADDKRQAEAAAAHATFMQEQSARYDLYVAALGALRHAFRRDPAMTEKLALFVKVTRRAAKPQSAAPAITVETAPAAGASFAPSGTTNGATARA